MATALPAVISSSLAHRESDRPAGGEGRTTAYLRGARAFVTAGTALTALLLLSKPATSNQGSIESQRTYFPAWLVNIKSVTITAPFAKYRQTTSKNHHTHEY